MFVSHGDGDGGVAAADIDVFIPFLYRPTGSVYDYAAITATIDYTSSLTQGSISTVTYEPYVCIHKSEEAVEEDGALHPQPSWRAKSEEWKADAKQGLMEVLLGPSAAGDGGLTGHGGALPAPSIAEDVQVRVRGTRCDATYVSSPQLMFELIKALLSSRSDTTGFHVECVTVIDMSHTQLGRTGVTGPPLLFDAGGNGATSPPGFVATRFYPDEHLRRDESPMKVKRSVAQRSLALTYVAPLLFTPGLPYYRVRELICSHCGLTDADAHALAMILRVGDRHSSRRGLASLFKNGKVDAGRHAMHCTLEKLDLSYNAITEVGLRELMRAIKHTKSLRTLLVTGNAVRHPQRIVHDVERQLQRNRLGRCGPAWLSSLRWSWKKSSS